MHNNNIKPQTPNPTRVTFSKEQNGIYNTGATPGFGALKHVNYLIFTGKKSNKYFFIPNSDTMSATERMKLAQKLGAPENRVDLVSGLNYTLLSGVTYADTDYVKILDK